MKLFAKRALLLTVLLLCLFGISVLAASAEITGATTQDDTHVASFVSGEVTYYYASLTSAISEAPTGSTITVLKNTALSATDITDKDISIVGSAKHTVTVASGGGYAFKLLGTRASLSLSNLVIDVTQTGKDTNAYMFGVSKSTAGTFTLTLDNVDTKWKSGSGAIYGYGSVKADISITNCSFSGGVAIINTAAEATNVTMYLQNVGCVGSVIEVNSGATSRVTVTRPAAASYASDAEAIAAGVGFRLGDGEGGATGEKYFWSLGDAITAAQSGDTVYVLANAVFPGGTKFGGKALTIQGANADVVLTHFGGGLQLNGGDVSLTIKDLTINSYVNFLDIYTSTEAHTVKLANVTVNSAAAANANFIYVSKTKANIEIVDCTFNSTNSIRAIYASSSANVTSLKITNSDFTNVYVARAENAGVIGSAETPAELTDLTSNKVLLYAYTGTIYADIFGGEFTGPLVYGGDNHNNYLGIRFNPTGEKTTTFTFAASSKYGAFVYQNPADSTKNSMSFSFRNTNITDSGKYAILNGTLTKANITVTIENSAFGESALASGGSPKYYFGSDADATAFGYTVRIGAEGTTADYYKNLTDALNAAPADDGNGGATMVYVIADSTMKNVGSDGSVGSYFDAKYRSKVHITSAGTTPFTVTTSGLINFYLGSGAEITFTNITFNIAERFARIDGSCSIIFGAGCTMNSNNAIFIYDNGNTKNNDYTEHTEKDADGKDVTVIDNPSYIENLAYTIDIQKGAVINSNGALSIGLIYRSSSVSAAAITLKVEGTIKMTAAKPILADTGKKASCTIYLDASNITCPATAWLSFTSPEASHELMPVYARGFKTTADAAAFAYNSTLATGMTYNADPSAEWSYTFIRYSQFTHKQYNVLNTYGGEIWQLRSATGGFYQTTSLSNKGTVTFKSYNGAYVFGQDASFRMQITNTTVIFDGFQFKSEGAAVQLNAGSGAKPSTLKLINGAKIYGTTTDSATLIKIAGKDTHLYVDSTSSVTQSGTTTSESTVIQATSAWEYGSIIIEGTIASTVTGNTTCSLIKVDSMATTYAVSVNIANFMDESGASTLGTTNLFLFPAGATPNLGLCTDDDTKVDLIKAYTVSISGVNQPAFGATKTVRGDFQHYYNTLAGGMLCVDNGGTVTVLRDIALSASSHYIEYKSFTIQGLTGNEKLTMTPKKEMFFIADNAHVTFKNLKITTDRFVVFKQNAAGASASLTLDEGAHVINYDLAVDNDVLVYNAQGDANITVNIKAGGSVICQSLSEVTPTYAPIYSSTGKSITVNVWGTLKNLAITPDGKNAQVFVAKGSTNNAVLNIYDGALIEGTADSEGYSGNYSGIVYFSEATNQINMYGGTVIIHGNTGFAYTGSHCTINISGGTIENRDGKYPLFFGGDQAATVSGTDEKKPTFIVNDKLIKSGTLNNAVNAFDESGYAAAATLGFAVIYLEDNNTAYTSIASAVAAVADGGTATIYVLGTSVSSEVVINNKNITLVGANITGYHITSTASYTFRFDNLGTLTLKDLRISATKGLIRYQGVASAIASANRDIYINFVNTEVDANGAANYLITSVAHHGDTSSTAADQIKKCDSITVTIDEDSEINFTTSATGEVKLIRYDHNTHSNVYTFIYGDVTVNATGDADAYLYLVRSNNPTTTQITVGEKANISITLAATRQTNGKSYFTSSVGGNYTANKLYLHADAITDDNGNLTLGGVKLYSNYYNSVGYEVVITANNTLAEAAIRGLVAENNTGLTSSKPMTTSNPIVYRAMADGVYYYTSELSTAVTKFNTRTTTGGLHFFVDTALSPEFTLSGGDITISAADGVTLTKTDEYNGTTYAKIDKYLFSVGSNTNVTFKNITVKSVRIINITANEAGKTVVITLDEGTTFEGMPNRAAYSDKEVALIYKGTANVDTVININAGATILVPATETANNPLINTVNGASTTVNVYGTMKNLATVAAGGNAQIFVAKTSCNAFFNVYDSAVVEGTSDNVAHSGSYSGIVYYSAATLNGINVYGGTITIHGRTGFAYTGTACNITISGGTINNTEALYPMFFGGGQTATITGKPTFNVTQLLLKSGTLNPAVNVFNESTYATAGILGFTAFYLENQTAYASFANAVAAVADGGTATIYVLSTVTVSSEVKIVDKNITLIGADFVTGDHLSVSKYFAIYSKGTLTFKDLKISATAQLVDYNANEKVEGEKADKDVTINFVNTDVTVGGSASVLVGSRNHYATDKGGCGEQADTVIVNIDADSAINFTTAATGSVYIISFNHNTHSYVYANIDGAVTVNCTGATLSAFELVHSNNPNLTHLNITETASLSIDIKADCSSAYLVTYSTGSTKNHLINIAAEAIFNTDGALTLDGVKLYYASATLIPQVCIYAPNADHQDAIKMLSAVEIGATVKPVQYRVDFGGKVHYYNLQEIAQAAATANSTTVIFINAGLILPDINAAINAGALFRLGGATDAGEFGVHYFTDLAALMEYASSQNMTNVSVFVLTTASDASQITLKGVTLTIDSVDSTQQKLTMSANPVFKLDEDAHLIVKNVKIVVTNAFAQVVNADTTKGVQLDLEDGAYVDITYASSNNNGGYFLSNSTGISQTGIVTVNVKAGSTINRVTTAKTSGGSWGLFHISTARKNALSAEGSSINVNGTINFGLTYSAAGHAPVFMLGDKNMVVNINDGASVYLCHVGASSSTWAGIFCVDSKGTAHVGNATLKASDNLVLFGINNINLNATLTVTGATLTKENFPYAVVYDYVSTTSTENNSQIVTFTDCTITCTIALHGRTSGIVLENVSFPSDAHAAVNYGVRVDGFANYYSLNKAVDLVNNGGTITLLGNVLGTRATITNKTITIQGADPANPVLITNSSNGSVYIFKCVGNVHLTLKNLQIDAKARLIAFEREPYTQVDSDGKERTYYYDVTSSSLSLSNTEVYGKAVGSSHNAMIYVGGGTGHHNFDLHIDATSSVGYVDGTPAEIKSTRNYQVIFYNASVTGDIVIEGKVYSYVYFQGSQVNYDLVRGSWTEYGPNAQHMIAIGNESSHAFAGNIVITETATLTHKVVFPTHDENEQRVYPEQYPNRHSAYAIRIIGGNASVIVVDDATITTEYQNAYQHNSAWIGFDGIGDAMDITYKSKEATLHYHGVGALLATLNKTDYAGNKITVATASGVNYNIVYDSTTYVANPVPDDAEATDVPATDAAGYDYHGAWDIAKLLNKLTNRTDIVAYDDRTTADYEIVVGIANRDVVQTYLQGLEMNEFAIVFAGNKILVLAWHDAALVQALSSFQSALVLCTEGTTVTLPNVPSGTVYKFVANVEWRDDFTKPADGTLWGGQYVDSNSLQYVYNGYADAVAGHKAFNDYCDVLEGQGYEIVWQNVIGNNLFRMYQNKTTRLALYVAYNDYEFKSTFYGSNGEDGLYGAEETDKTEIPSTGDLDDEYFENRDHQKVLRVVSMPLTYVLMPDEGINSPDFTYNKVTNTLQTTLSFQSNSVGLGHVYMLEDGRFLVIDGGGTGNTNAGDMTEVEAIYNVMVEMYTNVYGHAPTVEKPLHIAAWYLTHTHWDHVSAFNNFASTYGQDKVKDGKVERPGIVLDYVIANVPVQQSVYKNAEVQFSAGDINNLIAKFKGGNAKYIKVCTGQRLYLANLEIEVLMTFMDHAPFDIVNTNDTNTVTRFTIYNKLNKEDPEDILHTESAQVLYLGDSWRHSSRILCEMYGGDANENGNYLVSDIVQLAHHGNIGCERILYKRIKPTAVYFSHNAPSFKSYVYFSRFSDANKKETVCFRYAANVWCAYNAEYMWSAPYGTYNMLEFQAARPDYEGIKDLFSGALLTSGNQYDTSYNRTNGVEKSYIHNKGNATTNDVNIVWGDLSFTYQDDGSTPGIWNATTHQYEGATPATREAGWKANGDNRIVVSNASTSTNASKNSVSVELKFTAANGYSNFTGSFTDNGTATIAAKSYKVFTFTLGTTSLPTTDIQDKLVGNITVSLK